MFDEQDLNAKDLNAKDTRYGVGELQPVSTCERFHQQHHATQLRTRLASAANKACHSLGGRTGTQAHNHFSCRKRWQLALVSPAKLPFAAVGHLVECTAVRGG